MMVLPSLGRTAGPTGDAQPNARLRHASMQRKDKRLQGNRTTIQTFTGGATEKECEMRGILLWLIGIPIPIIILLYLFGVF
jgi:hypothetical protein